MNCGSGQRRFDTAQGWVNLDCVSREGQVPDVVADARALPYEDGSVEMVALVHVLEHFNLGKGDGLLREAYRVLTPSGSLVVIVPNLRALAQRWLAGMIDDYIFFVNTYGAYQGEEGDIHRWGFTPETLTKTLKDAAPWSSVRPFDYRSIAGSAFPSDWWMTSMEAVK